MPAIDAKVLSQNERSSAVAANDRALDRSSNPLPHFVPFEPSLERRIDYYLYIHNIANRKFDIDDRPLFKGRRGRNALPACPAGQAYVTVARIPNIVTYEVARPDSGDIDKKEELGERVAMDVICPSMTGFDQDAELSEEALSFGAGTTDMRKRGLFYSRNRVPTGEEIAAAKSRMEKFYRSLIISAETKARAGKLADINEEEHLAADYFNYKAQWHVIAEAPNLCPNCGEEVKQNVAYHKNEFGICVIDWRRTVSSGVKQMTDVPRDKRWWGAAAKENEQPSAEA